MMNIKSLIEVYDLNRWRKWWGNSATGEVISVPVGMDHDNYFCDHLQDFLDQEQIELLGPDAHGNYLDSWLEAAYDKGWDAVLFDGNKKALNVRGHNIKGIRRIVATLLPEIPETDKVYIEYKNGTVNDIVLNADDIGKFTQRGILPREYAVSH